MSPTFSIARRYNGPPDFGNGGYAAGMFARQLVQPVNVRLQKPVPLETPLSVSVQAERWEARAGDQLIAMARPNPRAVPSAPTLPSFAQAEACARDALAQGSPRFSHCFVCGAARVEGDGLRIFSGRLADGVVAAPWTPSADLANAQGELESEFLWAALDCPGYFATFQDGRFALLGELAVEQLAPVRASEPHVVVGWGIAQEGRKRTAGTALFDAAGQCRARGIATWIQVDGPH